MLKTLLISDAYLHMNISDFKCLILIEEKVKIKS